MPSVLKVVAMFTQGMLCEKLKIREKKIEFSTSAQTSFPEMLGNATSIRNYLLRFSCHLSIDPQNPLQQDNSGLGIGD